MAPNHLRSAAITVLTVSLLGPPIGGLAIGIWPALAYGVVVARSAIEKGEKSGLEIALTAIRSVGETIGFIVWQSFELAFYPALLAGVVLGFIVSSRCRVSAILAGAIGAASIPLAGFICGILIGMPSATLVPTLLYRSVVQCLPGLLALLACRELLIRCEILKR